jgi:hypothetical protein
MSDLNFSIIGARADPYAASPALALRLRIRENSGAKVDAIALRGQIRLDVQRYAETLKPMLWTHIAVMVPPFENETELELPIPCSYDFEVASHKYLASLKDGNIPLNLLFSGIVLAEGPSGVTPEFVPWSCEARYALPVAVWREAVDAFFPNSAWIRVNRQLFDELRRFKIATGLPTWDAALERLCEIARVKP